MGYFLERLSVININRVVSSLLQDKSAELQSLVEAAMSMVKSGDQEAKTATEKVEHLQQEITRFHRVTEVRIRLCLIYVKFQRLVQQVCGFLH